VGESFLKSYNQEFGLDYTIFRFFNTYGPKQAKDFVVSRFLSMALSGIDITVYGGGTQTRTFCYIDDNVDACYNAFRENKYVNDVVNIGGDMEVTILDLANKIISMTGSSSGIEHLPPLEDGDMTRRLPDVEKMNGLLKRQRLSLEDGLLKVLESKHFVPENVF
jgi:nucleoside-diphosphate-sugar epimerase